MNAHTDETETRWHVLAVAIWENEGGASQQDSMDHQYGQRVERDGSWSIYHVFTGVPARIHGHSLIGLSRSQATAGMLSLNHRNEGRRQERKLATGGPADRAIDRERS
jgi:hypothetical protein